MQDANGTHTTTFEHDAVGNVIKKVHDGISTTYTYNENDWLLQQNENGNISEFECDNAGNLIRERNVKAGAIGDGINSVPSTNRVPLITHSYNAKNELIASTSSANNIAYAYDANGIRNSKIVNGSATQFITDANREHAQVVFENSANNRTHYIYGLDLISRNDEINSAGNSLGIGAGSSSSNASGATNNATTSYFFYDALGSVKALSNNLGNLTDTYSYNAYGELTQKTGSTANNYLYTGEQYDSESSNYYLRARYYNPGTTRFTQMDTWAGKDCTPITLNKYAYANASPTMYIDPSGHMSFGEQGAVSNIQGILSTASTQIRAAAGFLRKACEAAGNVTAKGHWHHLFPFYTRGVKRSYSKKDIFNDDDMGVFLVRNVHQKFHSVLDLVLRSKGFSPKSKGYKNYTPFRSDAVKINELLNGMELAADIFDEVCDPFTKYKMGANMRQSRTKAFGWW